MNPDLKGVTLSTVSEDLLNIMELIDSGEIPQDQATDLIEQMEGAVKEKAVNVAAYVENLDLMQRAIKEREETLAKRRKAIAGHIDWLKGYLKSNMERHGITKIEAPEFVLRIQKNPVSVVVDSEAELASEFITVKTTKSPDKKAIKAALEAGEDVPGCHLAHGTRLVIK